MTDNFCISNGDYVINTTPTHYVDIGATDKWQREVYMFARDFCLKNSLKSVVDVGCGDGYKLVQYLGHMKTIGVETEPCISYLKKTYPDRVWVESGESEKSFINPTKDMTTDTDMVICSDVIEHILNPDSLVEFLLSIRAKYYILSTPCRDVLVNKFNSNPNGPPGNSAHVREWSMDEFKKYISKWFLILESHHAPIQIECQYHLLALRV